MSSPEELRRSLTNFTETRERPLEGKVALVTGSSRDIGAGIARVLAQEGVAVIGNYRDKEERARKTAEKIKAEGGKIEFVQADITVPSDREKLQRELAESFGGKLDYLILSTSGNRETARAVCVEANNALVDMFLPHMRKGEKVLLVQSVPGHFAPQLRGLGKMPDFYDPIAEAKYEGEQSLRLRISELQEKGVSLIVVCPPEVEDTFNMRMFKRLDPLVSEKHADISDMLGIPRVVTTKDVGEKVVDIFKSNNITTGHVDFLSKVREVRSFVLLEWYDDNAIFVDTLEMIDERHGIGRLIVAKEYTKGHFNEKVGISVLPGHIMIEAAAQTLGLIALNGRVDNNSMPMFQGIGSVEFARTARPGEGLKINGQVTEFTKRGFVGNVSITNMKDEKVAEVSGLKAVVVSKNLVNRLLKS